MDKFTLTEITAWRFAETCLWPMRRCTPAEQQKAIQFIRSIFSFSSDPFQSYLEFCQRVLLYRQYCIATKGKVSIPSPDQWFEVAEGFALTSIWFRALQEKRKLQPLFMHAMKALSEAVLEISEDDSEETFHYWEKWFRMRNAMPELRLFYLFTAIVNNKNPAYVR